MKTLTALLFALSLYLLPNPTHSAFNPIRLPTAADDTPVLDTDGDALRAGQTYFITSKLEGFPFSAGPQLAWLNSTAQCPSNVVTSRCLTYGDPIRITPADPNATVVLPSTFLSFAFFVWTSPLCASSVYWGVQYEQPTGLFFLNSGEFDSNLSAHFKIEADEFDANSYTIAYCPFGGHKCYNVNRYVNESADVFRWVLTDYYGFPVVFRKTEFCPVV